MTPAQLALIKADIPAGGFTISGNAVSLVGNVTFPAGTGGNGVTPQLTAGTVVTED